MTRDKLSFQFISEPSDVNYGGKVHGGMVMKWIDQVGFACASAWSESYCVTVYVGGIRFFKPIHIGDIVKVDAQLIYTGNSSMHIAIDVFSRGITKKKFQKTTHCIVVFVAVNEKGETIKVNKWIPDTDREKQLEQYAIKLMNLRRQIEDEMEPFLK